MFFEFLLWFVGMVLLCLSLVMCMIHAWLFILNKSPEETAKDILFPVTGIWFVLNVIGLIYLIKSIPMSP
jgi:hypothetical protein